MTEHINWKGSLDGEVYLADFHKESTVMILSFPTPKTFVVITLKFELCGFTRD